MTGAMLQDLWQDTRYGLKLLAKNPSFTVVSVLTLALGIGATSTIFSVMTAAILRPLPFPEPDRLVWIDEVNPEEGFGRRGLSTETLLAWRSEGQLLEGVAHFGGGVQPTLAGERVNFSQVDIDTLRLLGVPPILGRWYESDEVIIGESAQTIVISYGLWQRQFGGDPDIVGQTLPGWTAGWGEIIIGVMPPGFYDAPWRANADAWNAIDSRRRIPTFRRSVLGRLKPGVNPEQARAEMETVAARFREDAGVATTSGWEVEVRPFREVITEGYGDTLYLLLGAVGFVLLIACANVANLQLSRAASRRTEMATRAAMGAGRLRLVRQLLVENVLLGLLGGGLGVLVAVVGMRVFVALAPTFYLPTEEIHLDSVVLLFTLGVSVLAGLLFGLIPALGPSRRPDLHTSLRQSARGLVGGARQRIRQVLVVSEVALALVLLAGAGLMINSYVQVISADMGFDPDNLLTMEIGLAGMDKYRVAHDIRNHFEVTPEVARLFTQVRGRIEALPGVENVGMTSGLPPNVGASFPFRIVGRPGEVDTRSWYHEVDAGFFETMRIPLLQGRTFSDRDAEGAPGAVIVNEAVVRQFFPGEDPVGQLVQVNLTQNNPDLAEDRVREIVGVVQDTRLQLRRDPEPVMYVPYQQHLWDYAGCCAGGFSIHGVKGFVIRASNPTEVAPGVRAAVAEVDPTVAVDDMMPMRARLSLSAAGERFLMRLFSTFAGLGVFLAAIGVYGVVSYTVAERTDEFGIRTALGAKEVDVLRLVLREGLLVTLVGLVIGFGAAFGLTRLIANYLYGVTPTDPITLATVSLVLVGVALLACYLPARRAARADPMVALRVE